jgi:hypothetical protein
MSQLPMSWRLVLTCCGLLLTPFLFTTAVDGATLKNVLVVPGSTLDRTSLSRTSSGANVNRLGGFASDLYYDRFANVFYGLSDRGPGGGTISYDTRVHEFTLDIDPVTGVASNFHLLATIHFAIPALKTLNGVTGSAAFNGVDPMVHGDSRNARLSHDPEGFVVAPDGHFYVSDEYVPSIYEFMPDGTFVRAFTPPSNVLAHDANGLNFAALTPAGLVKGRQVNRGFEGLAINPEGSRLFAMLQDPLMEEGASTGCTTECSPPGRFSRNVRLVVYNTSTGRSIAQYIYQLESLMSINTRVPGNAFSANSQGSKIGISALTAINDHEFLVLERDDRGFGVDDPTGFLPVSTKRIYRIDIAGATDVSGISLAGTNTLPARVLPVTKTLFIDVLAELRAAGATVPEKIEGLTIGPQLVDGTYEILVGTDNDFSVTQKGVSTQLDVCTNGSTWQHVAIDAGCPVGLSLIPSFLMSFKTAAKEITLPTPTSQLLTLLAGQKFHASISGSLTSRLRTAQTLVSRRRRDEACSAIQAFSLDVSAQSGKIIPPSQADRLRAGADSTEQALGCR